MNPPAATTRRVAAALTLGVTLTFAIAGCTSSAQPMSSGSGNPTGATASTGLGRGLPAVPGIVKEVSPSVVTIYSEIALGSGVVYRSDGTIVTDAHVVENKNKQPFATVRVQFADGQQVKAKVLAVDNVTDVAVIKADRTGLPVLKFATTIPEVGQMCVVVGSPLGLVESATAGIVSALHRDMPPSQEAPQAMIDLMQTDAPISPGNSGGAVVNGAGQVIGLAEAYLPPSTGAVAIGFVTPATTVTTVADQLLKNGKAEHAFLGIRPEQITPQLAQRFGLPDKGVLVAGLTDGGPAAQAGVQVGDVITGFAGSQIGSELDLLEALRHQSPGERVHLVVQREGKEKTVSITLADRP